LFICPSALNYEDKGSTASWPCGWSRGETQPASVTPFDNPSFTGLPPAHLTVGSSRVAGGLLLTHALQPSVGNKLSPSSLLERTQVIWFWDWEARVASSLAGRVLREVSVGGANTSVFPRAVRAH